MSAISIATAKEVLDLLHDDLAAIEREFATQSNSPVEVITDIATYLMSGGGKRIRPTCSCSPPKPSAAPRTPASASAP